MKNTNALFKTLALTLSLSVMSFGAVSAGATTNSLGLDSTLNLLSFSDIAVSNSDVEGRVAVGGNASIQSYSIDAKSYPGNALTVAGNLDFTSGSINGNTVVGGYVTSGSSGTIHGALTVGGNLGYDFAAEKTRLTSLSTQIASQKVTAAVIDYYGTLKFNVSNSNGINIFDITAAQAGMSMEINGLGSAGTVIINVSGSTVAFGNHGFNGFYGDQDQVLFNLADATSVSLDVLQGSILAPNANVSGNYGVVNGQVVANSWKSSVQVNSVAFVGSIPVVTSVPEPETYAMLIAGLGLMGLIARRRKQVAA